MITHILDVPQHVPQLRAPEVLTGYPLCDDAMARFLRQRSGVLPETTPNHSLRNMPATGFANSEPA